MRHNTGQLAHLPPLSRGMRIGFVRHFHEVDAPAHPEMAAALEEAARVARGTPANLENCGDYLTGIDDGGADAEAAIRAMGEK